MRSEAQDVMEGGLTGGPRSERRGGRGGRERAKGSEPERGDDAPSTDGDAAPCGADLCGLDLCEDLCGVCEGGAGPHEEPRCHAPLAADYARAAAEDGVSEACLPRQLCQLFDPSFAQQHPELWASCSVVVGMHPDQACAASASPARPLCLPWSYPEPLCLPWRALPELGPTPEA